MLLSARDGVAVRERDERAESQRRGEDNAKGAVCTKEMSGAMSVRIARVEKCNAFVSVCTYSRPAGVFAIAF